jgi:hypothetical protein
MLLYIGPQLHDNDLCASRSSTRMCIFAACDRPTVVYSVGGKLVYANVDVPEVSHMTSFNSQMFPDCLAMASENELTIGANMCCILCAHLCVIQCP